MLIVLLTENDYTLSTQTTFMGISLEMATIAIVQPQPTNQRRQLIRYVKKASRNNVDLILFPEGFFPSYVGNEVISLNDNIIQLICDLSKEYHLAIATGIKESCGDNRFLSLVLVQSGEIIAIHRKVMLTDIEKKYFDAGRLALDENCTFPVIQVERVGMVGLLLCYENLFPETHRLLRLRGAEVVLGPSGFGMKANISGSKYDLRDAWLRVLRVRAMENQSYIITSTNALGENLMGVVINPLGEVLMDKRDKGYGKISIDLSLVRELRSEIKKRRPQDLIINFNVLFHDFYKLLFELQRNKKR